mmetsp:Transcript_14893/g.37484  ORF Transcript_14893/g.37484 Transcript_14893/m.37484 type:complete len:102 (-) Transcript_14893:128-433(-)
MPSSQTGISEEEASSRIIPLSSAYQLALVSGGVLAITRHVEFWPPLPVESSLPASTLSLTKLALLWEAPAGAWDLNIVVLVRPEGNGEVEGWCQSKVKPLA